LIVHLLVTRPEPDASDTAALLWERGHAVDVAPMMRIALASQPPGLPAPVAILLTSRNAARAIAQWPASAEWRALPVYAVGSATAALAGAAGFAKVREGPSAVAGLADLVRAEVDPAAGAVLYPAGRDRSADLAALLAGFRVVTVEAYRGIATTGFAAATQAAIAAGAIDGVLFFSRRTAAIFAGLVAAAGVGEGLRRTTLFALSASVAEPLGVLPAAAVMVAPRPDEESLLGLIPPAQGIGEPLASPTQV
jgi:uroporphyrinogen-III synthase